MEPLPSENTPWAYVEEYGRETLIHRSFLTHWWTLDRALSGSSRVDAGYVLNGEVISSLAFADDVVLIASTKRGLEDSCKAFLDRMRAFGPVANPAKCATLATVTDGKRKTFYVDPTPFLTVAGAVVPCCCRPTPP